RKGFFNESIHRNIHLIYATVISILATLLVVYTPLQSLFEVKPIGWISWIVVSATTLVYMVYLDIVKLLYNVVTKRVHLARIK
ncbi:cation transporting ATPase C-terminal domain-containing protein, partial [Candidatus Woesebacteria bacterium]|nr:cation transporting ATPase C-terminal domain-containing protein [Candidatus Woesebacteria bacterium]